MWRPGETFLTLEEEKEEYLGPVLAELCDELVDDEVECFDLIFGWWFPPLLSLFQLQDHLYLDVLFPGLGLEKPDQLLHVEGDQLGLVDLLDEQALDRSVKAEG